MLGRALRHNCSFATIANKSLADLRKPFPSGVLTEIVTINPNYEFFIFKLGAEFK